MTAHLGHLWHPKTNGVRTPGKLVPGRPDWLLGLGSAHSQRTSKAASMEVGPGEMWGGAWACGEQGVEGGGGQAVEDEGQGHAEEAVEHRPVEGPCGEGVDIQATAGRQDWGSNRAPKKKQQKLQKC